MKSTPLHITKSSSIQKCQYCGKINCKGNCPQLLSAFWLQEKTIGIWEHTLRKNIEKHRQIVQIDGLKWHISVSLLLKNYKETKMDNFYEICNVILSTAQKIQTVEKLSNPYWEKLSDEDKKQDLPHHTQEIYYTSQFIDLEKKYQEYCNQCRQLCHQLVISLPNLSWAEIEFVGKKIQNTLYKADNLKSLMISFYIQHQESPPETVEENPHKQPSWIQENQKNSPTKAEKIK